MAEERQLLPEDEIALSAQQKAELLDNLFGVRERIRRACERSGRDPADVRLIAVSKTKPIPMIEAVNEAGIADFGENKPQELMRKCDAISRPLQWHMIGHLQRNKVKYVVGRACMVHSVDSVRLALALQEEAAKKEVIVPVLIEVNMAGEDTKFGVRPEDALSLAMEIAALKNLSLRGLMTIAPFTDDPESNRPYFREMRNLSIDIASKNIDNISMCELSMGMTGDFETAIEEGATMVRVGTGIFGSRY